MDKKSKILFGVLAILIVGAIVATYDRIYIKLNYPVMAEISCDPILENCFVYECTPEDDPTCSSDPAEQVSYYKIIEKKAANIPSCDPNDTENCPELSCAPGEADCQVTLCTTDNEDEIPCSDDEQVDETTAN